MAWQILEGDCIDVMRTLPAESVDAVVTSPPYAMQRKATYGGVPEAEYPAWTVAWMAEARRLLKPDGSVIINIRPHVKGGQISDYTLRTRIAVRDAGWAEIDELIWHKPNSAPMGHVGRPRRSWESLHWFAKHGKPFCNPKAAGPQSSEVGFKGTSARANKNGWGHDHQPKPEWVKHAGTARVSDVARVPLAQQGDLSNHPAPFPPALAEWVGKLICPTGGTILDPFSGSASTGVACIRNGWNYIGIEAMAEYADMSRRRLEQVAA